MVPPYTMKLAYTASLLLLAPLTWGVLVAQFGQSAFGLEPLEREPRAHLTDLTIDKLSLLDLHERLVSIPSVSGSEHAVAVYLARVLEQMGLTVELERVSGGSADKPRYNVYAYQGRTRNTTVVVTSHIDTVPPYIPYHVEGTKIFGRGSCDAKGSVVSQIFAVLSLIGNAEVEEGQVSLLYVVGEEVDGSGMSTASRDLNATWELAIFGEPTELKLGVGHKGNYFFELVVKGHASHSGYPELGTSATEILVPVLQDLLALELPLLELLGPSTLNIGRIDAGVAANVIPARAYAQVLIRVAADLALVDKLVRQVVGNVAHLEFKLHATNEPQYIDYKVDGFESIVLAYATDIPNLVGQNLTLRYLYGPGSIHVAHGDNEYVENEDLLVAVEGYRKLIKHVLAK